jgi:glucokinase
MPVVVDNDANCAVWAEVVAGAGVGSRDVVLVTLGTGIGGGLVADGVLRHGIHGFAGEPGHMVVDPSGPRCPCGRNGCWERFASGSGLVWLARRAIDDGRAPGVLKVAGGDPEAVDGEVVAAAARAGDEGALVVFQEFSWWLATGIANLVSLLDPEVVLIGGGLADESDLYLERTRAEFATMVMGSRDRTRTRIEVATLGSTAGAIGAALLAAGRVSPG